LKLVNRYRPKFANRSYAEIKVHSWHHKPNQVYIIHGFISRID